MTATKSFGVRVFLDGVQVTGLTDVAIPRGDVSLVETTTHDSTAKEYVGSLKDGGTMELSGRYNIADAGQTDLRENTGANARALVVLSDGTGAAALCQVGKFDVTNPPDDTVGFSASLKISGIVQTFTTAKTGQTYTTALSGTNNDLVWTCAEGAPTGVPSVEYVENTGSAETLVTSYNYALTVSYGTKARMIVTGTLYAGPGATNPRTFSPLLYNHIANGKPAYRDAATSECVWNSTQWVLAHADGGTWTSTDPVATPDLVTTWTPQGVMANGTPTVTAGVSSAAQVIAAATAAATGITAANAADNDGTGAIAALSHQHLTGGTAV